jgi:hypothetical protein
LARAKRTDRNEARRRYRAEQAALATEPVVEDDPVLEPNVLKRDSARSRTRPGAAAPAPRPGIMTSLRAAYHPLDLRGDLAALPTVVTHWAVLASVGISVISTVAFIALSPAPGAPMEPAAYAAYLAITMFVVPPPAAGGFLIGFTAKRASWLGGLVQGIVAAVCYLAVAASPAAGATSGTTTGTGLTGSLIFGTLVVSPIGAAFFASAAAWYRRFLNLANPNRGQRPARGAKAGAKTSSRSSSARRSSSRR